MHMRGEPRTMQKAGFARDVMKEVLRGLRASVATARKSGVVKTQILLDPGIGFGKSWRQNYELLARLEEIGALGFPVVIGTSRKGFLAATLARDGKSAPSDERVWGTAATVAASILHGAHIVRVHDVAEMAQVARVTDCVLRPELAPKN
jgi:dihydropteroate synthase